MSRSDCTNPTSIVPVQQHKESTDDDCRLVLAALLVSWPEVPDDDSSSGLLDHLCECRNCRQKWLALEIAADLAVVRPADDTTCDTPGDANSLVKRDFGTGCR